MEEFAKAPPEQLDERVCPEDMMAAAAATADIMATHVISTTTSTEEPISTKPAAAATKPPAKSTKAYDKKWLENLNLLKPCIRQTVVLTIPHWMRKHRNVCRTL